MRDSIIKSREPAFAAGSDLIESALRRVPETLAPKSAMPCIHVTDPPRSTGEPLREPLRAIELAGVPGTCKSATPVTSLPPPPGVSISGATLFPVPFILADRSGCRAWSVYLTNDSLGPATRSSPAASCREHAKWSSRRIEPMLTASIHDASLPLSSEVCPSLWPQRHPKKRPFVRWGPPNSKAFPCEAMKSSNAHHFEQIYGSK